MANGFKLPFLEDDEQNEFISPLMAEQEAQRALTTPVPDFSEQMPMLNQEMSNADQIENEMQDVYQKTPDEAGGMTSMSQDYLAQQSPVLQEQGNLTEQDIQQISSPKTMMERYTELKRLQDEKREKINNLAYLQAGNQIAQGIASGHGGKIGDGSEAVKGLKDAAGMPVEDYLVRQKDEAVQLELQNERELNDADSDISKFMRQQALAFARRPGSGFNEASVQALEKMTAKQLQKLGFKVPNNSAVARPGQQSQYMGRGKDGKQFPLTYNANTNEYTNPLTKEVIGPDVEIIKNVVTTDFAGNKLAMGTNGMEIVSSSTRKQETPEQLDSKVSSFSPDKEQREALDKETGRLDTLSKTANEKMNAANLILSALDGDSKQAFAVIKTQMPRLAGEVGNLNQTEQEAWKGSQALLDELEQYIYTKVKSTVSPDNAVELRSILGPFLKNASSSINSIMDASANRMAMTYQIPPAFMKKAYGVIKPVTARQQEVMDGKTGAPSKVKAPSTQDDDAAKARQKRIAELKAKAAK